MVFTSGGGEPARIAGGLERAVVDQLGVRPRVVVLTCAELAQVVADNPFPGEPNPRNLHAVFRNAPPGPEVLTAVAASQERAREQGSRDQARVAGRTVFLHTPDGFGRSELAAALTRATGAQTADAAGTARNSATVPKLLAMCG